MHSLRALYSWHAGEIGVQEMTTMEIKGPTLKRGRIMQLFRARHFSCSYMSAQSLREPRTEPNKPLRRRVQLL